MKQISIILLTIILLVLLSGCWNRKELNELAIVMGLGIDKIDNQYLVTAQVVNPGEIAVKGGTSTKSPVVIYQEKGKTLFEAFRRVTTLAPRRLYFSHLRFLVYGEEVAREGIGETLDILARDQEMRTDFYITVAKGTKGGNILRVLTALEKIPVNQLYDSLEASQKSWAPTITITLDQLIAELMSEGIEAKLTGITLQGNLNKGEIFENVQRIEPYTRLKYEDIGVFKADKLIGWLNETQSKGLNDALGNVSTTIIQVPCPTKGEASIEVLKPKSTINTRVSKNGLKGIITYKAKANVGEVQCKTLNLMNPKAIKELEKKAAKEIKNNIQSSLIISQRTFETDIFGFGDALHRANPRYWKKVKAKWNQQFKALPVEVKIKISIKDIGTIKNSPLNKIKY